MAYIVTLLKDLDYDTISKDRGSGLICCPFSPPYGASMIDKESQREEFCNDRCGEIYGDWGIDVTEDCPCNIFSKSTVVDQFWKALNWAREERDE